MSLQSDPTLPAATNRHKSTNFPILINSLWHFRVATLTVRAMLKTGESITLSTPDGFAARLRQVLSSYGSTSSLARTMDRSEGALRKWLRGLSEPNVTDLRAICEITGTSVEWLVMGRGPQKDPMAGGQGDSGLAVRDETGGLGAEPLPPLNYRLMDEVVRSVRRESDVLLGNQAPAEKQSSVLTTVYNMSRRTRVVDSEEVARVVGLTV
jgi:transcriptional regulator with XRE-family HTH domain